MTRRLSALVACLSISAAVCADIAPERLRDVTAGWEVTHEPLLWGFRNLYNPCVVHVPGSDYPFRMWLFGWAAEDDNPGYPGYDAIFHARSRDLRRWEVYAGDAGWDATMAPARWVPVVTADDKPYSNFHAGDPSVVLRDGVLFMAFSSVGVEATTDADGKQHLFLTSCVMGATSDDGIRWAKSAAPIAIWQDEYANRWELEDGKVGSAPADYMGSYHRPALLYDAGRWRLWFDYFLPGTFVCMGYGENTGDFLNPEDWHILRAGERPLLRDWPNASLVRAGEWYYSFSDAPYYPADLGGEGRLLTMARSRDGLGWEVLGHLRPEPDACSHVPEALVIDVADGRWLYVFYSHKPVTDPWDFRYTEIRMMRHRLAADGSLPSP